MILAGDIGGTKCNLALYEVHSEGYRKIVDHRYESREFASFDEVIKKFLLDTSIETKNARVGEIEAAGFGVAGPVIDHRVKATNLPWIVDGRALAKQLATDHVIILNDLGSDWLQSGTFESVQNFYSQSRRSFSLQSAQALVAAWNSWARQSCFGMAIIMWLQGLRGGQCGSCAAHRAN